MEDHSVYGLRKACYECRDCPLGRREVDGLDPHVFGSGHVSARVMFVGEAPGAEEVKRKAPLVGRSGQFYETRILAGAGLERKDVWTTNGALCRPANNRTPFLGEMEACRRHLDAQVMMVRPFLIVTLGNAPLYAVCDTRRITRKRGSLRWSRTWSDGRKIPVFPMFHPAYCLRGSGLKEMEEDIARLKRLVVEMYSGSAVGEIRAQEDMRTLCDLTVAAEMGGS